MSLDRYRSSSLSNIPFINSKIDFVLFAHVSLVVLLTTFMLGCATLNESECRTANWEIIGLEDGSRGKPSSYIGNHRQACAEHNVSPDLSAYLRGHKQGLRQYCTYDNGLKAGMNGAKNANVCTGSLKPEYTRGYRQGMRLYRVSDQIHQMEHRLAVLQENIQKNQSLVEKKENEIVEGQTSRLIRRQLIKEIKILERDSEAWQIESEELYLEMERLQETYTQLRNQIIR